MDGNQSRDLSIGGSGEGEKGVMVKCAPKEWPLFEAPGLSSMRVVGYREREGTLFFTVLAILEGFKWKIDRTYDEFVELQKILVKTYSMNYPMLSTYNTLFGFSFFGGVKKSQAEEMRSKLEAFVMSAVTSFPVPPTELLKFVEYPFTDVLSVTQALAKFFYIEGEIVLSNDKAVQMSPLQIHCINKRMTLPLASSETGKMKDDFGHLLDFLQNLRKLKISPPTEDNAVADLDTMTFDLNLMRSLEILLVESIKIHRLEARYSLPKQLVKLEVRRSLKFLQDILLVYPLSEEDYSPMVPSMPLFTSTQAVDLSRAMPWEKLQQANFKLNGIKKIDESVKLLPALERMDLSYNYIEEIEHLVELPHLRVLDFSHNKISCLVDLHTKLGNITKLGLASNNIVKLNGLQKMFSIQYLDLSYNQISDATELQYLNPLPCLEKLILKGNPLTSSLSYRSQVFSHISQYAEQVALDGTKPSKDELVVSISTPTTGHKRVHTPDIVPDEEEDERHEAVLEDMEAGMGMTNRLEELRKEGGDDWLSILNADKRKEEIDSIVASKSPRNTNTKKKKTKHHKSKNKSPQDMAPVLQVGEANYSHQLTELMETVQEVKLPSILNFEVTLLEYRNSSFLSLSPGDLDQILLNTAMEECVLSVDTLIGKALEVDLVAASTRVTRNLRLIHYMKVHEGKRLAICLQLPSSRNSLVGGSRWVIYCIQNLKDLARLYHSLNTSMTRSRSETPDRLIDILPIIQSDALDSSLHDSLPRPLSESDSQFTDSLNPLTLSTDCTELLPSLGKTESCEVSESDFHGHIRDDAVTSGSKERQVNSLENTGEFTSVSLEDVIPKVDSHAHTAPVNLEDGENPVHIAPNPPALTSDILQTSAPSGKRDLNKVSSHSSPESSLPPVILVPEQGHASESSSATEHGEEGTFKPALLIEKSKTAPNNRDRPRDITSSKPSSTASSRVGSERNTPSTQRGSSPNVSTSKGGSSRHSPNTQGGSSRHSPNTQGGNVSTSKGGSSRHSPNTQGGSSPNVSTSKGGSSRHSPNTQGSSSPNVSTSKGGSSRHSPVSTSTPPAVTKPTASKSSNFPGDIKAKLESLASPSEPLPSPIYGRDEKKLKQMDEDVDCVDASNPPSSLYEVQEKSEPLPSDKDTIETAISLSDPEAPDSRVAARRNRKVPTPHKPGPRKIIAKPGLEDNNLRMFFKNVIADDTSEILMNVTWGVSNLSSAPSCEIEVGIILSDRGIYLLEVLDPEKHQARPLSWTTENFPLAKIMCCYHSTLRKVNLGIFDQSLTVESFEKGVVKRLVFFPHNYQKLNMFVENLKAAFDAYKMPYFICSSEDEFVSTEGKGLIIQNPSSKDMTELKGSLILSYCRAQVGNFIAANSKSETNPLTISFNSELKRVSSDTAAKFEIVQYVIVGEIRPDILPISNGDLHVLTRALILTNKTIYLCKEELDSWPRKTTSIRSPPFPRCTVIDSHPISRISGIKMCDKSHPIVSCTDPLYEFSISFEELDDIQLSPTLSTEWLLCVHDRQYLDQLLGCLTHLSNEHRKENHKLVSVKHITSRMMTVTLPTPPKIFLADTSLIVKGSKKSSVISNRGMSACFISSKVLFDFSVLTNYQRLKFFKRHIAQAEFLKSDEIPLSVFLAHCSCVPSSDYVEVESCVVTSNYGIYLLSDLDNIQQWVAGGGFTSFPRKDLLDKKNSGQIRCFYRLWLNEIKLVDVGVFYSSVSVTDTKESESSRFTIHTENSSATLSFLSALSCMVDLHDTDEEKEMDCILSDYDFVVDSGKTGSKKSESNKQHYVEFSYHSEDTLDKLKKEMVEISPAIKRGSHSQSSKTLKILYQQVMLLVEELRIRDLLTSRFHPHLVFLTNYGIYVCLNRRSERCSPSVLDPNQLSVKKWCHIDLVERLHVYTSRYSCYNVVIYLHTISRGSLFSEDSNTLSLLVQNSELLNCFLYHFSLMYHERCGKQISITRD